MPFKPGLEGGKCHTDESWHSRLLGQTVQDSDPRAGLCSLCQCERSPWPGPGRARQCLGPWAWDGDFPDQAGEDSAKGMDSCLFWGGRAGAVPSALQCLAGVLTPRAPLTNTKRTELCKLVPLQSQELNAGPQGRPVPALPPHFLPGA